MTDESGIIIRNYDKSDWPAIERIHDSARKMELKNANLEAAFLPLRIAAERENLMDYDGIFVAEWNHIVAGFAACTDEELAWLYVDPAYMHRGIGRKLSQHALSVFPHIRCVEVLKGNIPAKKLYESLGFHFVKMEKGRMPGNEDFSVEVYLMQRKV
ncbi:MAG: GNAT family N-acetyltransferase [Clostridiales bacterium]|nr:GNAT family N-acetyltransferase [Clostridiales bacterium]